MFDALPVGGGVNPPLYFILAWVWQKVFGNSEIALRSLSALLGTATMPVVYAAARELASRRAGLLAAALAATSPLLIWYSQEVRPIRFSSSSRRSRSCSSSTALTGRSLDGLWAWALASGLALATHYFAFTLIVPEAIWLLLRARAPESRSCWHARASGRSDWRCSRCGLDQQDRVQLDWLARPLGSAVGGAAAPRGRPQRSLEALAGPGGLCVSSPRSLYALIRADRPSRRAFAARRRDRRGGVAVRRRPGVPRERLHHHPVHDRALAAVRRRGRGGPGRPGGWPRWPGGRRRALRHRSWPSAPGTRRRPRPGASTGTRWPGRWASLIKRGWSSARAISWVRRSPSIWMGGASPKPGERIATSELVLLSLRPVRNYGIGPCFWGAVCGGIGLGGSGPPFKAPPQFQLRRSGLDPPGHLPDLSSAEARAIAGHRARPSHRRAGARLGRLPPRRTPRPCTRRTPLASPRRPRPPRRRPATPP